MTRTFVNILTVVEYLYRPHYVEFPKDEAGFSLDDQYFVGSSGLLVKPVTEKGVNEASVYLPPNEVSSVRSPRDIDS